MGMYATRPSAETTASWGRSPQVGTEDSISSVSGLMIRTERRCWLMTRSLALVRLWTGVEIDWGTIYRAPTVLRALGFGIGRCLERDWGRVPGREWPGW